MKLYHGTNIDIETIDLSQGLRYKDFGKGFYATPDRVTAVRMAQKRARLFGGTATLITYELDELAFRSDLKIKRFPEKASVEWFLFVDANRDRKNSAPIHKYDIVIGPIANDGVVLQLTNYHEGIYSPEQAAQLLQDKYLDQQYYFGTEKALVYLHKINAEIVWNQPNHHQIATYLTDYVLSELVKYVMEDTGCGIEQAMEKVYKSPLTEALQDEENELYVQSPAYLYELMKGRWQRLRGIATAPEDFDYKQELASRYEL